MRRTPEQKPVSGSGDWRIGRLQECPPAGIRTPVVAVGRDFFSLTCSLPLFGPRRDQSFADLGSNQRVGELRDVTIAVKAMDFGRPVEILEQGRAAYVLDSRLAHSLGKRRRQRRLIAKR